MTGYTDTIRRWATDTRRSGPLRGADGTGEVGLGEEEAGTRLAVRFAIRVQGGAVATARFEVFGCGFTIAACAAATELAEGRALDAVQAITAGDIDAALEGLPAGRGYCAELAAEALHAAVAGARSGTRAVQAAVNPLEEHGPRVSADDPVYRALTNIPVPAGVAPGDRHLFACLLAVAAGEPFGLAEALGLTPADVDAILGAYFPTADRSLLADRPPPTGGPPPEHNDEVLAILLAHVPQDADGNDLPASTWLARILATRAAHPGHLWTAMGFFERPELTAAIRRHLPALAAANDEGMRWKRYLFKQVCDMNGGVMCKSPNCGVCSDYALCFESEER